MKPRFLFKRALNSAMVVSFLGVGGAIGWQYVIPKPQASTANAAPISFPEDEPEQFQVRTIKPKRDASLEVTVHQIASVHPFFQAMLRSRVSGEVRTITKDIGDRVRQGEILIEIDVPDLEREVAQKESFVQQRQRELSVCRAQLRDAEANSEVARSVILQKQTEVSQAEATRDLHHKRLARYKSLAGSEAIPPDVVDEQERDALSWTAAVAASRVAVERARADLREKEVKVEVANADIDLKATMVEVARRDMERTRALADYARITAPFDGVILRRNVGPGSFVQNASTGQSETLLTIARTDLITVVAKFPDNVAPFISRETEAIVEIDELSGMEIAGKVSRYSPSIQNSDRTMQVEVDLFNAHELEYRRLLVRTMTAGLSPLASRIALQAAFSHEAACLCMAANRKGADDRIPPRAVAIGPNGEEIHLLPGMTGSMKLRLKRFANHFVLPSGAVYTRGGKPYILLVREGLTKQVPVHIQLNDGKLTKLSIITRQPDGRGGMREVLQELTGEEEIVASRQVELSDGQEVHTNLMDW